MGVVRPWIALALLLPGAARAQSGFDAHGLYLGSMDGDPRDPVTLRRPGRMVRGDGYAGGVVEVLHGVARPGGLPDIDGQIALDLAAGYAFHERARLDVAGPVSLATTGDSTLHGPALGDLRVSALLLLARPRLGTHGGPGLGLVPWVMLPTGPSEGLAGDDGLGGGLLLSGTWEARRLTLSGEAGLAFPPADQRPEQDAFEAALALTWSIFDRTSLGIEGRLHAPLVDSGSVGAPAEALVSLRHGSRRGPHLLAGAALGAGEGWGVPAWRVFVGGGFGVRQDPDPDGDLLVGDDDECPDAAEQFNGWHDRDGCPDDLSTLVVVPRIPGGDAVLGASVEITDGRRKLARERGPAVFTELVPYRAWCATAEHACWTGAIDRVVPLPGRTLVGLPLERRLDARLRFVVTDSSGAPLDGAVVRWVDDGPDCSPLDLLALPAGVGVAHVGAGYHTVVVSAPGRAGRTFRIAVPRGADELVAIELGLPEVLVRADRVASPTPVHFERGRVEVVAASWPVIDQLSRAIVAHPELGILVIEPPRAHGRHAAALGARRALAVRDQLVRAGVPASRLVVAGHGAPSEADVAVWGSGRVPLELSFQELPEIGAGGRAGLTRW